MTLYEPTLSLARLIVLKDGRSVYDEKFHPGLNMIRGANSSGKTTIAEFIYYSLGGEVAVWRAEARACDYVVAEALVNGNTITLRRQISDQGRRPMEFFWGPIEDAKLNGIEGWEIYPFARQGDKISFSDVLLSALQIPRVRGDLSSQITMHQLLRLMYIDQSTPFDEIFRFERFDSPLLREATGDLLCGVFDDRLYEVENELKEKGVERESINRQLKSLGEVLGASNWEVISPELLVAKKNGIISEKDSLYEELEELRTKALAGKAQGRRRQDLLELDEQLKMARGQLRKAKDEIEFLDFEIEDSRLFIASLSEDLASLGDAAHVRRSIGLIPFTFCPDCYTKVEPSEAPSGACPLCKTPLDEKRESADLLRLRQEIALQVGESRRLQEEREAKKKELLADFEALLTRERSLEQRFRSLRISAPTATDAKLGEIHRKIGYADREIEDVESRLRLAQSIEELRTTRDKLEVDIGRLEEERDRRREGLEKRKRMAVKLISDNIVELLKNDSVREDKFAEAREVTFSFRDNRIRVDGQAIFGASSMVILKNSFHLALLEASLQHNLLRYPRFALFDNIEDKGMEVERSHRFQRLLAQVSSSYEVEHQIIFTTSMPDSSLEREEVVVGERYSPQRKSLAIGVSRRPETI